MLSSEPEDAAPAGRPSSDPRPDGRSSHHAATDASSAGVDTASDRSAEGGRPESAVLPDVTTDECDIGWGEVPEPSDDDRYLREVPPHHGS